MYAAARPPPQSKGGARFSVTIAVVEAGERNEGEGRREGGRRERVRLRNGDKERGIGRRRGRNRE